MLAVYSVIALVVITALLVIGRPQTASSRVGRGRAQAMVRGALWAVVVAFPLAAVCALIYRFPMPMAGYRSGPTAVPDALLAAVFYGLLGGFPALLAAGAAAGAAAYNVASPDPRRVHRLVLIFATAVAALGVGLLANLDRLIGPW